MSSVAAPAAYGIRRGSGLPSLVAYKIAALLRIRKLLDQKAAVGLAGTSTIPASSGGRRSGGRLRILARHLVAGGPSCLGRWKVKGRGRGS